AATGVSSQDSRETRTIGPAGTGQKAGKYNIEHVTGHGDGSSTAVFCAVVVDLATIYRGMSKSLSLAPTCAGSQAQERDGVRVRVSAVLAFSEQPGTLIKRKKR